MGASYVPEIFMPSEKRILSPVFHDSYFVPPLGFPLLPHQPAKRLCATCVIFLLAQNSVYALFCDVQAAFLGRFTALKSSLHWPNVKRIKAVEKAFNRCTRKIFEMPANLFYRRSPIALKY